jgi:biopolymer transport protein ExbD
MAIQLGTGATGGRKPQPIPVMNVTPLVDIALVVLIIFMLVVPMAQKTFWLNFPKQEKKKPNQPEEPEDPDDLGPLVMTISSRGTIRVNKAVLRKRDIPERLPRMLAAQDLPILYFDAADTIPYGQAVEVMDIAKLSGAKAIAVLTERVAK